jgi:hypothetical protein
MLYCDNVFMVYRSSIEAVAAIEAGLGGGQGVAVQGAGAHSHLAAAGPAMMRYGARPVSCGTHLKVQDIGRNY